MKLLPGRIIGVGVLVGIASIGELCFGDLFTCLALWMMALAIVFIGIILGILISALFPSSADPTLTPTPPLGPPLRPLEPVWRYRPSVRELTCPGCGGRILKGELTGRRDDRPEVFDEHCARTLSVADDLGLEGVRSEYAAGRVGEDRRDQMLEWLLRTEVL